MGVFLFSDISLGGELSRESDILIHEFYRDKLQPKKVYMGHYLVDNG